MWNHFIIQFSLVQPFSHVRLCDPMNQHARPPWRHQRHITNSWSFPNSSAWSEWCHPTVSSSVIPFSSRLQSFPASEPLQMSQLLASGGQRIGVSASASVLSMNIHDWFPLGWTDFISLQSKGLSRVFSSITIWRHQFFGSDGSVWGECWVWNTL